jgi:hypothetical protein
MLNALLVRDKVVQLLPYHRRRDEDVVDGGETGVGVGG